MKYLVRITPLEPYTFGTDQGFKYAGTTKTGKETYLVRSTDMPEQTTVLGMLRYLILQHQGLIRGDFRYSEKEREWMNALIGPESFSFTAEKQNFGCICSISPVFLINDEKERAGYYVKNPFHNTILEETDEKCQFRPMKLTEKAETSEGTILLPGQDEYKAKKGYARGFYNLNKGYVTDRDSVFKTQMLTGNRKNGRDNDQDGFFKREVIRMENGYSFAVFVETSGDVLPEEVVGYMGQKRSAFLVKTEKNMENDLEKRVKQAFKCDTDLWYYALSDLFAEQEPYNSFCIIEKKQIRNLETVYPADSQNKRLKKSEVQYQLIQSGSVFHGNCPLNLENENHRQIGYNQIIQLGGSGNESSYH